LFGRHIFPHTSRPPVGAFCRSFCPLCVAQAVSSVPSLVCFLMTTLTFLRSFYRRRCGPALVPRVGDLFPYFFPTSPLYLWTAAPIHHPLGNLSRCLAPQVTASPTHGDNPRSSCFPRRLGPPLSVMELIPLFRSPQSATSPSTTPSSLFPARIHGLLWGVLICVRPR